MDRDTLIKFIEPIAEYRIGVMLGRDTHKLKLERAKKRCRPPELDDFDEPIEEGPVLEEAGNGYLIVNKWNYKQPENAVCGHESAMNHWLSPTGWISWCQTCGRSRWARLNKKATTLAQQVEM
jgi:hypothetical protein